MRWQGRRGSGNIEDRRRMGSSGMAIGGAGGLGILAIVVIGALFGVDLTPMLGGGGQVQTGSGELTQADEQAGQFVSVILADTEDVWSNIFQTKLGQTYEPTTLVLFSGVTQSGCGGANAQTGPFYCPVDKKVYLDTDFFQLMDRQLGAGGDFADAYVVAHEVGHHVQDLLGILDEAQRGAQQGADSASVRTELQADCFAGVWASYEQQMFGALDQGDVEEAVNAAQQIGDDTLQQETQGVVVPDSFTHGTSAQRVRWFMTGYQSGDIGACDTFRARQL
ncbi:YpfJ protein, zinc metalloprotease superfamily [Rubellimicrobium mesophilum DSM 19309]|uniref:YpfJ protein, zinc metalloprotease superfamily n=1 Tax=Rubellimicrobium mesophilum DSM 19309 TaxID=442562 RepID=A0A017HGP8_9RHOB|nr:neutral zinc metallopeptidase [Rubellimicrobium mesophilum]EYD73511.1 YpfJ protein, zinc metalloprotease superfamily [Rubellimicrobium mesophilum DSM 19309]